MYALIVKNSENTWDVWRTLPTIPFPEREARLQAAIKSNVPITGKNVTNHKTSVKSGGIWDGSKFSGGDTTKVVTEDMAISVYAYMCDNLVVLLQFEEAGTELDKQLEAIFDSETTIINIPENQTAKPGDIWNGENIVKGQKG